jgi:hypothetical protein
MRSLFIVVSKIYGLVQAYTGLTYIFILFPMLRMFRRQGGLDDTDATMHTTFHGEQVTLSAISLIVMVILTFGLAWLLVFRASWLADRLKIPSTDFPAAPSVATLLYAGTKLIGLLVVVQGAPLFAQALFQMHPIAPFGAYMWETITAPLLRILIGVLLMIKTTTVVTLIMGRQAQNITLHGTQ